jgi:hypothetical protein
MASPFVHFVNSTGQAGLRSPGGEITHTAVRIPTVDVSLYQCSTCNVQTLVANVRSGNVHGRICGLCSLIENFGQKTLHL